jgi:hypothetical protein
LSEPTCDQALDAALTLICWLRHRNEPLPPPTVIVKLGPIEPIGTPPPPQEIEMVDQVFPPASQVRVTLVLKDAQGFPTSFDTSETPVEWTVTGDDGVIEIRDASADNTAATLAAPGPEGSATVTITGDIKQGEGVVPSVTNINCIVAKGDVAVLDVALGMIEPIAGATPTPEPRPEPPTV